MKTCYKCKKELPFECFHCDRAKQDKCVSICKQCKSKDDKRYQEQNKEKIRIRKHQYYLKNKNTIVAKVNDYIKNNRDKHNAWGTKAKNKLKTEVFSHYGEGIVKCANCSEDELRVLSIDHIEGNGNRHRKETGMGCGYKAYQWLKKNNYPNGFQVLCWNCQFKKRYRLPDNPTKGQLQRHNYRKAVKIQCLEHYGSICPCGETDLDVLSLDHVNNDGRKHRLEINSRGFNFYIYLRKNGFPNNPSLQVLCMNCQYRKRG